MAAKLKPGLDTTNVVFSLVFDDTPHRHTAAWDILVVMGFLVIVASFWRGWLNSRRGRPTRRCKGAIAIAAILILASSLVNSLFSFADVLSLHIFGVVKHPAEGNALLIAISGQAKGLGFSIGLATVGAIAYILLASRTTKDEKARPPAGV